MIELILAWLIAPKPYEPVIAVEMAWAVHGDRADSPDGSECCGECEGGKIIHGDGHITDCPCPSDCECKTRGAAVVQPSVLITPGCADGSCKR